MVNAMKGPILTLFSDESQKGANMSILTRERFVGRVQEEEIRDFMEEMFNFRKRSSETHTRKAIFAEVCRVMDFSSVDTYLEEEVEDFLVENGLTERSHILMATHSMGGRDWKIKDGRTPAFFRDEFFNGGWYAFVEEDVEFLLCKSGTSGSIISAVKESSRWELTLEVPVSKGVPYKGSYWRAFHSLNETQLNG
jgi:hypothetical protein